MLLKNQIIHISRNQLLCTDESINTENRTTFNIENGTIRGQGILHYNEITKIDLLSLGISQIEFISEIRVCIGNLKHIMDYIVPDRDNKYEMAQKIQESEILTNLSEL